MKVSCQLQSMPHAYLLVNAFKLLVILHSKCAACLYMYCMFTKYLVRYIRPIKYLILIYKTNVSNCEK